MPADLALLRVKMVKMCSHLSLVSKRVECSREEKKGKNNNQTKNG